MLAPVGRRLRSALVVAVVGWNGNEDKKTARLVDQIPGTVLALGNNAYAGGSATERRRGYDPTWGILHGSDARTNGIWTFLPVEGLRFHDAGSGTC